MDIQKRLFRRPFTTILWGVLVTAMALLLCVGAALWYSSENLVNTIDPMYTAAAFRTDEATTEMGGHYTRVPNHLMQEDVEYLESLDSVEAVLFHTLTGGCSPSFSPVVATGPGSTFSLEPYQDVNESYDDILFIATVQRKEAVWPTLVPSDMTAFGLGTEEYPENVDYLLEIEEFVLYHPEYQRTGIKAGDTVRINLSLYGDEAKTFLEPGQRYVFCAEMWIPSKIFKTWGTDLVEGDSLVSYKWSNPFGTIEDPLVRPVAAKLEGTLEKFLADPENALWAKYVESWETAQHSLPIIGTENLESMYSFLNQDAFLVEGRTFTQEEYDSGAKVCVLSETLAAQSGVQVGDTISISQFYVNEKWNDSLGGAEYSPNLDGRENNPTIGEFDPSTEFITEDEEFTVIGLYRKTDGWEENSYSFTVNTVFIPKKAQIPGGYGDVSTLERIPMEELYPESGETGFVNMYDDRGNFGIYLSVLLKKGYMEDFELALSGTELAGKFIAYDQGYEAMIGSVKSVGESSRKLLYMASAGWALLLTLYVLLYQGGQRKNLGTMRSLGAKPKQARRYLFGSGMGLAAVSVILGTALSGMVTGIVNSRLLEQMLNTEIGTQFSGGQALTAEALTGMISGSQLPGWVLIALMGTQIIIFAIVLWLHAAGLSRKAPRKLLGV